MKKFVLLNSEGKALGEFDKMSEVYYKMYTESSDNENEKFTVEERDTKDDFAEFIKAVREQQDKMLAVGHVHSFKVDVTRLRHNGQLNADVTLYGENFNYLFNKRIYEDDSKAEMDTFVAEIAAIMDNPDKTEDESAE